jgi:predicted metal-dependent hydrolase
MARPETARLELPLPFRQTVTTSPAQICLGGKLVSYTVKRSRRRSIALTIDEHGLRVGAPGRAGQREIEAMLRKHDAWVLRKLAEWQQRQPPPRHWQDGETLMLLGQPLRLTLVPDQREVCADGNRFIADSNWARDADKMKKQVTGWLRQQALGCFRERVAHFHPLLKVPEPQVRLSNARTRWGSCHADGRIRLNWRLIQMPLCLIDYVVVHELAHLLQMNHSPRFWTIVAGLVPDYKARRAEIRTGGHRYLLA